MSKNREVAKQIFVCGICGNRHCNMLPDNTSDCCCAEVLVYTHYPEPQEVDVTIKIGKNYELYSNPDDIGVEGYELNELYEISDIRIMHGVTQIFLKGNIHAYYPENFIESDPEPQEQPDHQCKTDGKCSICGKNPANHVTDSSKKVESIGYRDIQRVANQIVLFVLKSEKRFKQHFESFSDINKSTISGWVEAHIYNLLHHERRSSQAIIDSLQSDLDEAVEYAKHKYDCEASNHTYYKCTCGFQEFLNRIKESK